MRPAPPSRTRLLAATAAALVSWCPGAALGGDDQELAYAKSLIDAAQWQQAEQRFARLLDPASPLCPKGPDLSPQGCLVTDPTAVQTARGYYAIVLMAQEKRADAKPQIQAILRKNPTWTPSPAVYGPAVISLYNEVKKEMEAEEAAKAVEDAKKRREAEEAAKKYDAWVDEIEKLAQRESTTVENSRWIAAIPFGVGQFQNDDIGLGVLFASAEGSAVVVAVVTGVLHADLVARGKVKQSQQTPEDEEDQLVTEELNANLRALQIANNVSMGALAALIIAGIIEAEVNFVPETPRSRQRKVPKRPPKPKPVVSVTGPPAGGTSGVGLRLDF